MIDYESKNSRKGTKKPKNLMNSKYLRKIELESPRRQCDIEALTWSLVA